MSSSPTIRTATSSDAPRLAELSEVLGYPVEPRVFAERLDEMIRSAADVVLVAESESEVVGWLHGSVQASLVSGHRCEILGMVVDTRFRGTGIGRALVEAVEAWALERGMSEMVVRSNVVRAESHPFYERLGYARTKTQHHYGKRLQLNGDAVAPRRSERCE